MLSSKSELFIDSVSLSVSFSVSNNELNDKNIIHFIYLFIL